MKKGGIIALIVILSILVIVLIQILVMGAMNGGNSMNFSGEVEKIAENIRKEEIIDMTDIKNLEISITSANVEIIETQEEQVRVVQYVNKPIEQENLFSVNKSNGRVRIQDQNSNFLFNFKLFNMYLESYEIYVPKTYQENIEIKTVSSDISSEMAFQANEIKMTTTSGNIKITNQMQAKKVAMKSVSGEIQLGNIESEELTVETTSGEIEVISATNDILAKSISGEIDFSKVTGKIKAQTTSGNIKVYDFKVTGDSSFKSVSGEIMGSITPDSNCDFQTKSVSGNVRLPDQKGSNPAEPFYQVNMQTTSGNIKFQR